MSDAAPECRPLFEITQATSLWVVDVAGVAITQIFVRTAHVDKLSRCFRKWRPNFVRNDYDRGLRVLGEIISVATFLTLL